ncbi:MAG: phage tail sheath subtilisin-like domain-containing protein, partial [Plesiomonas sp.]
MAVSFNSIPSGIRVPLFYAEMDNSAANSGQFQQRSLLLGHGLSSSTNTKNALTLAVSSPATAALVGKGSQLADMVDAYRRVDSFGELWVIDVPEPSAGAAAAGKLSVTGTAISPGIITLYYAGIRVQVAVAGNDSATAVATAIIASINSVAALPITAAAGTPATDVVLTAKWKGLTGNDISVLLNYRGMAASEQLPNGINIAVTAMAGGAGSPDLSAAIAAMGDEPFDFIGMPWTDSASLDALRTEMNDSVGRWSWSQQIYGHVYSAKKDTLTALTTFGRARNDQHCTITALEQTAAATAYQVAASTAARNAVFIRIDPARPTQTGELDDLLPAPTGKTFTLTEKQTLLTSGMATTYAISGVMRIERAITTYQKNAYGDPDDSYLDSETLHTSAYVLRRLKSLITSKYGRHKLANDGTRFGAGQAIVTPAVIKGEILGEYAAMERDGIVENFELFSQYLIVERDSANPNRLNVLFPPDYVNQLRVFAVLNQFRLQYPEG